VSIASLTLRAWLRYVAPLKLLAAAAMLPIVYFALVVRSPTDIADAHAQLRLGWIIAGSAWMFQLWLVAAAAPLARGIATAAPPSQADVLSLGARSLARAAIPGRVAVIAIAIGGIALVVPGLALFALLCMTGASTAAPLPAQLHDSIAIARANLRLVAIVAGAVLAVDLAIAFAAQLALVHAWPKKPPLALLLPTRTYVRVVAAATIVISPLAACAFATIYARRR
jgi:hypothetical protein